MEAAATVADATGDFFAELGRRGHEPLLQKLTGTFRFDVTGERDEHWFVRVSKGDVTVSRRNDKADCSVRSDRDVFDAVVGGEANALAATLRGAVVIDGDIGLLAGFQRLFPGPPAVKAKAKTKTRTKTSSPAARPKKKKRLMTDGVRILDGNTFVVSDRQGDIEASATDPSGLFSYDTRFISQWVLTIDGRRLTALSVDDLHYWETRFFLVPGMASVYTDSKVSVIRQRAVGGGFREEITILNHDVKPIDLTVRIDADSDFADLFEVKDALAKKGSYSRRVERGRLVLGYERETYRRATVIEATTPAKVDEGGLTFKVRIESHGEWSTAVDVTAVGGARRFRQARPTAEALAAGHAEESRPLARAGAPARMRFGRIEGDLPPLPRRSCGTAFLAGGGRRQEPAGGRAAVVHDDVRPRQHLHEPAGAALHVGAGPRDPARARGMAGNAQGRFPRRGSRADHARDALRRVDGVRGAAPFAVLRRGRHDPPLRDPARRVRALDR